MTKEILASESYERYEKMFPSLINTFDWALGHEYLKSDFVKNSLIEDYEIDPDFDVDIDIDNELDEIINLSRADTIGEIYSYAASCDSPTHLIDQAYDIALEEN